MDNPELLPCPFCGGTNLHKSRRFDGAEIFRVGCNGCTAVVEDYLKDAAIAAWNNRARRAAPGVQGGETWHEKADRLKKCVDYATSGIDLLNHRDALAAHLRSTPTAQQTPPAAVAQQSAQPVAEDAPAGSGGWKSHALALEHECAILRECNQTLYRHAEKDVWYWQGQDDNLHSMADALPVVIRADQFRALLAAAQPVEVQRVGLTDAEIDEISKQYRLATEEARNFYGDDYTVAVNDKYEARRFARAIEANANSIKPASTEGGAS